jgi:hypothetical protein
VEPPRARDRGWHSRRGFPPLSLPDMWLEHVVKGTGAGRARQRLAGGVAGWDGKGVARSALCGWRPARGGHGMGSASFAWRRRRIVAACPPPGPGELASETSGQWGGFAGEKRLQFGPEPRRRSRSCRALVRSPSPAGVRSSQPRPTTSSFQSGPGAWCIERCAGPPCPCVHARPATATTHACDRDGEGCWFGY